MEGRASNSAVHATHLILSGCLLTCVLAAAADGQATSQPLPGLTDEQTAQLLRHRAMIENAADSERTRQTQAEELLLTGWPAAVDLLIELLETTNDASTRVVICRAVARAGADHPGWVDVRLAEPLVRMLGDGDPLVSTSASAALATFRETYVIHRLTELAGDSGRALAQRLAAIDALAPNIDQRLVIKALIELLDVEAPTVHHRVLAALAPAARVDYGPSIEAWISWWQDKSMLDETAWLEDRVELFAERARELELRLENLRRESDARYRTLSRRLGDVLRRNYRLTPQGGQKDELLVAWLRDPLIDSRRIAVDLVREQIYDQKRPSEVVRAALRERYGDVSADLRREVLELVAALNDPADMEPILARLAVETDVSVRETILGVLGKLRNPAAIDVLIDEIADDASPSECVAKAASSLAMLARERRDPTQLDRATAPLQARLAATDLEDPRLRGALLGAMAAIGSAEFAAEFVTHLAEEDAELLLPAIRGVTAVGERSQMGRLRTLFQHSDPRVRRQAIEAVGALGGGAVPLEALANRLNVATEPNDAVRSAAWSAFCRILKREPAESRLGWAARLKELPGRQIEYLTALVGDFVAANPVPAQLNEARALLARRLREQARYAEAVRHLQELYASRLAAGDPRAGEAGALLLDSLLRNGQYSERIDELLPDLAQHGEPTRAEVVRIVTAFLDETARGATDPESATALAERIRKAATGAYGQPFDDYLRDVIRQLEPAPTTGPAAQP